MMENISMATDIEFIDVDQNWTDDNTVYWFLVDGKEWGISETKGVRKLVDSDGYPIPECNDHDNMRDKLCALLASHLQPGMHISVGDDHDRDSGYVDRIVGDMAIIRWDSGVTTPCPVSDCEVFE